jgi:Caspase domain
MTRLRLRVRLPFPRKLGQPLLRISGSFPMASFLAASLAACSLVDASATRRLGLMIGANDGGRERVRLHYAGTDAQTFARSMQELGGIHPDDRLLLQDPDSAGLGKALHWLTSQVQKAKNGGGRVEAVIYYSGHADEQGLLLKGKRFAFPQFRAQVDAVPADVRIAIVDACASGALTKLKGGRTLPAFLVDASSQAQGYAFLTSSSATEAAQESDRIGASFFSHYLNTGLRGAADASQDGRVTLHEAYQYAYHETLARTEKTQGGPQHAGYDMRIAGSGDVVMTDLGRAEASLGLPDSLQGRFFIRDAKDRLVAEVQKPAGMPLRIALEPGQYRALWHSSRGIHARNFTLQKGYVTQVLPGPGWTEVSREIAQARGTASDPGTLEQDDSWSRNMEKKFQSHFFRNWAEDDYRGTQLAFAHNHAHRRFNGQQIALIANTANASVDGIQAAGALNHARGPVFGGQAAFGANVSRRSLHGLQVSGMLNFAQNMPEGFQGSGGSNWLWGDGRGVQATNGFNWVRGNFIGIQLAGMFNHAAQLRGGQGAFALNTVGGNLNGTQITTFLNIVADTVSGHQIGLINIAEAYHKGSPIGLLNFVGEGVWRGDAWVDESGLAYLGLVTGSRHMQTRLAFGSKPTSQRGFGAVALEATGHLPLRPVFLEAGLLASIIDTEASRGNANDMPDFVQRVRLSVGVDMGRYVSVAGGVSWVMAVSPEGRRPWTDDQWLQRSSFDDRLHQWPGAHVSVRMGTYGFEGR